VQAAGQGQRLGLGPKAFVELGRSTLLERAVVTMLCVSARVVVAVPTHEMERAARLVGGAHVQVIAGGARRSDTLRLLVHATRAPWLVLHDAVRPFVTAALAQRVLEAARRHGAAAAGLANDDFLYAPDGTLRALPHELVAVQKPVVFSREAIVRGLAVEDREGRLRDPSVLQILALGGQSTAFVPGDIANIKVSSPADYGLAQRLAAGELQDR
jgi:2-C-methyl-D-erythritol 4-phosphate cytidylyltransferase